MNFLSFQFTSLRSRDASSSSPRCSLFLDLQRKNGHALTPCCPHFPVPPRAAASCSLCNPFKATAAARPATAFTTNRSKINHRARRRDGDGEKAVDVSSLGKLVSGALPYSAKVMVGKVAPMQPRRHSGRAAFRRV